MRTLRTLAPPLLLAAPAAAQLAAPSPLASSSNAPTAVVMLDVDRDGDDDIVTTASEEGRLVWFETRSGGTIAGARTLVDGLMTPWTLDTGDVDGDGDADILVGGLFNELPFIVENLGPSSFALRPLVGDVIGFTIAAALDDADADGDLDAYFVVDRSLSPGSIFLFENDGTGTFGPPVDVLPQPLESFLYAIVRDADGDGAADVILRRLLVQDSLIYLRSAGGGALAAPVVLAANVSDRAIAMGDVDGDGDLDLVSSSPHRVIVRPNDGAGGFGPRYVLPGSTQKADSLLVSDLDGDGDDDVIAALGPQPRAVVFESLGGGAFVPQAPIAAEPAWQFIDATTSDIDGDGVLDVIGVTGGAAQAVSPGLVSWFRGPGLGGQPAFETSRRLTRPLSSPLDATAGDFDGDGDLDVVASAFGTTRLAAFEAVGSETFRPWTELESAPNEVRRLVAADLDGDGRADLIQTASSGLTARRSLGALQFAPEVVIDPQFFTIEPIAVDVDQDGDLDLVASPTQTRVAWYENLGGFQWSARRVIDDSVERPGTPQVADLDGDGIVDLAVAAEGPALGPPGGEVKWYRGTGAGFAPGIVVSNSNLDASALGVGDVDDDGRPDLVWSFASGLGTVWARNLGGGSFDANAFLPASPGRRLSNVVVDVDGDGDNDLVHSSNNGVVTWFEKLSGSTFAADPNTIATLVTGIEWTDLDLDGDQDLLLTRAYANEVSWAENLGLRSIGSSYCGPGVPNASGRSGRIRALGSNDAARNAITLRAGELPPDAFGFFLNSRAQGITFPVTNSVGRLCLAGNVGRHAAPDEIRFSGADGAFSLRLDLSAIPTPTGFVAALAGETWNFQAWHRDVAAGTLTSNFTDAVSVTLQ